MNKSTSSIREQMARTQYREHSTPMFLTSSFTYDSAEHAQAMFAGESEGYIYSRFSNPNSTELIAKMCTLEGCDNGVTTASGMAAIFNTLAALLKAGDHVVASKALFGNSLYILQHILPQWGIKCTLVDIGNKDMWESSITEATKLVLIETPTNPSLELIDIPWLAERCHNVDAKLVVDNCFATPIIQQPKTLGADIIIHSATKWIDGQGRVLGGIVVGSEADITPIYDFIRRTGACMSPFHAWLLSKSLETLDVRIQRHCENALALAQYFEQHKYITNVRYPFLSSHPQYDLARQQMSAGGGLVTIDIQGGQEEAFRLINALTIPTITANLGDTRTIITHPASTTHSKLSREAQQEAGILDATVRISVGLEGIGDLKQDFEQALQKIGKQ